MQASHQIRYKPVFLTGMPGSGKSYWAPLLADKYQVGIIDLDWEIQQRAGKDIPAIFREQGEGVFRELETDTLKEVINNHTKISWLPVGAEHHVLAITCC